MLTWYEGSHLSRTAGAAGRSVTDALLLFRAGRRRAEVPLPPEELGHQRDGGGVSCYVPTRVFRGGGGGMGRNEYSKLEVNRFLI